MKYRAGEATFSSGSPLQQVAGKAESQNDPSTFARIIYSSLNQAPAPGCPWRWDPQGDDPLVWPTLAISGPHYNSWQHQPGVSAFPSKWGELLLQSSPHALAPVNVLRRELPLEQTRGGSQWGGSYTCRALREEKDVWREEAAHSHSSGGATTRRTAQMCSYCSLTMDNFIVTTTSLVSTAQRGLTRSRAPTQVCCTGIEPPRGPCSDMGLKMACSASGRVKFKVCKFYFSRKKKKSHKNKAPCTTNCHCTSVISRKPTRINQD